MKFNQTLSYFSPLIAYSESSATVKFTGTGVWLWGPETALPQSTVSLDGNAYNVAAQSTPSSSLIYSDATLQNGVEHVLDINPASALRSVTWQMDIDADIQMTVDDSQLFSQPREDDSTTFTGSWIKDQCLGVGRHAATCHTTSADDASLQYTFQGDAITVWGAVENSERSYSVSVDGSQPIAHSGNSQSASSATTMIAHANNLGPGSHTITLKTAGSSSSRLEIDYIEVFTKESIIHANDAVEHHGITTGTKIALIVGCIGGTVLLVVSFFAIMLYRQRQARLRHEQQQQTPSDFHDAEKASIRTESDASTFEKGDIKQPIDIQSHDNSPPLVIPFFPEIATRRQLRMPWSR